MLYLKSCFDKDFYKGFYKSFDNFANVSFDSHVLSKTFLITEDANESEYKVLVNLAGYRKDEVTISESNSILTITAEKQSSDHIKVNTYVRCISLSDDVDVKGIVAEMDNGLLTITLPKITRQVSEKGKTQIKIN